MKKPVARNSGNVSISEKKDAAYIPDKKTSPAACMNRVTAELVRAQRDLNPEAIHDLRVALRRCFSIAEFYMEFGNEKDWKKMKKQGRRLFKRLGELRDTQVMMEWLVRLSVIQDSAGSQLASDLSGREAKLCKATSKTLSIFNRKKWNKLRIRLSKTSRSVSLKGPVYKKFALERWQKAYDLHRRALRNQSQAAFHRLRIGLKRFRYTVENILPQQYELWGNDLKLLQDELGEHHDLFLLRKKALKLGVFTDGCLRAQWHARIEKESRLKLQAYRAKTVGKKSVWPVWRSGLLP
jgi:CHAD domain-containing protein